MIYKSSWKVIFIKIFASKKGFGFVIEYAWISKLLRARHLHDGREAVILIRLKKVSYFEEYCYLNSTCITESIGLMFMNSSRDKFSLSFQSLVTDIFLLISVRHVGAHPDGHQHGVSIQISINLGKPFSRISLIRKIALAWILAMVFAYLNPLISLILDFIYWTVLIFILVYFEWRDTENQQFGIDFLHVNGAQHINQGGEQFVIFWMKMSRKFV